MGAMEVGQKLVEMVNSGRDGEAAFVNEYYADNIVSIEGGEGSEEMPSRIEGVDAIRGKHSWWYDNNGFTAPRLSDLILAIAMTSSW